MNRRTLIAAAPAAVLAGATLPATAKAEGVTSPIWAKWEAAQAEYMRLHHDLEAMKHTLDSDAWLAAEDRATEACSAAQDIAYEAFATPAVTAADVVGKARIIATAAIQLDDWGGRPDMEAALVESLLRDLAAAHGITGPVANVVDPEIAARDAWRAKVAARDAQDAAMKAPAREWLEAANRAGMKPCAIIEFGTGNRYLQCDLMDVDTAIAPLPPSDDLGKAVVDLLIFNGRVHYAEAPATAKGHMTAVPPFFTA